MKPTDEQWIRCPICGAKTRARLLPDTVLRNFPLFCPKCRQESIINAQNYHVIKIKVQPALRLFREEMAARMGGDGRMRQ